MEKIIGSGKAVKLEKLIKSDEITDKSLITVYDAEGKYLARGEWYTDWVLKYADKLGKAHKSGTGLTIIFKLM